MPIDFSSIPCHIQTNIIKELDLQDFVRLQQSSEDANKLAKETNFHFHVPNKHSKFVDYIYHENELKAKVISGERWCETEVSQLRIEAQNVRILEELTEDFCRQLLQYFCKSGSSIEFLDIINVSCSALLLKKLVEIANVRNITFHDAVSPECFTSLSKKNLRVRGTSPLKDEDFLELKEGRYEIFDSNVTNLGLNTFIRELHEGKRNVDSLVIETHQLLVKEHIFRGIDYAETNLGERFGYSMAPLFFILCCSHLVAFISMLKDLMGPKPPFDLAVQGDL